MPSVGEAGWLTMVDMMGDMGGMPGVSGMSGIPEMSGVFGISGMSGMDHSQHGAMHDNAASSLEVPSRKVRHVRTEYGLSTDIHVDMTRTNFDDPDTGLHSNGRHVLALQDMHTIGDPMDSHGPQCEVELYLTDSIERYAWPPDGVEFGKSIPVHFRYGECLRAILHNGTMMTRPMYMHGMWSEFEAPGGTFLARRHMISMQSAQRISFLVTADALGRWAWHCHLVLHMDVGIFREVIVA